MHKEKNENALIRATITVAIVINPNIKTNSVRFKPCSAQIMLSIVASPVKLSSALLLKIKHYIDNMRTILNANNSKLNR